MTTTQDAAPADGLLGVDGQLPCQVAGPLFFAGEPERLERAKSLCAGCPVRLPCLAGAMQRQEPWGVWGGELFEAGRIGERKRPRGRPRKHLARA